MGEQSISLSMPHIAEMTISAVINWEKIKRMEMKERMDKRVSDLSEVENGKLYNLKEKLLSQNPKCRTCKVNPFCWNCIATIKENTENGAMDDYCSKVKAFYFNTVWGE